MANEKQFPEESGLEHNIIKSLLEKYEATEETTYLASSEELITSSREKLSRETMDEIFKIRSKYHSQLKIITTPTPIGHEVVYISPQTARDMLKFSRRGAIK